MWDGVLWYGGASLPQIDLSYFDETTAGVVKVLVSGLSGVEVGVEIDFEGEASAGFAFGFWSAPTNWVAGAIVFEVEDDDDSFPLQTRRKGEDPIDLIVASGDALAFYNTGAYSVRIASGLARLYYPDGTDYSLSGVSSGDLLLFPGIIGPQQNYRFAPDLSHALSRTGESTIQYRDNTGDVRTLAISGATLPQFSLSNGIYTYVPPYLYAVDGVQYFNPATQTVTVYRNLVDLDADTVTLDGELQAQCKGIAPDPDDNDPTPLSAAFYPL